MFLDCRCWVQSQRFSLGGEHRVKTRPSGDWMDRFQTDSKIGFQFIPSEKLSLVANYSHCQLTSQPALSQGPHQSACQICSCPSRQSRWWKQTGNFCGAAKKYQRAIHISSSRAKPERRQGVADIEKHVCVWHPHQTCSTEGTRVPQPPSAADSSAFIKE